MEMHSSPNQHMGPRVGVLNPRLGNGTLPHPHLGGSVVSLGGGGGGEGSKGHVAGGESKRKEFHFPSCSSIGNQDKPGTTVRRENTRSHSDLDMWNRLAPYVLRLFGRHGKSTVKKFKLKNFCE